MFRIKRRFPANFRSNVKLANDGQDTRASCIDRRFVDAVSISSALAGCA
jgi:hypothetical protein